MNTFKFTILIMLVLAASRFIPHPPNFTSLLALSFYIPCIFGIKFIPIIILSLAFTDFIIGLHSTILFTWGSVILIGLLSNYFSKSIIFRICGALGGALIFFIITNFGVWTLGSYDYTFSGLALCYALAIPFFRNSLISTAIYSFVIEILLSIFKHSLNKKLLLK